MFLWGELDRVVSVPKLLMDGVGEHTLVEFGVVTNFEKLQSHFPIRGLST